MNFLFAFEPNPEEEYDFVVYFNPNNTWEKEHKLADHYTNEERNYINPILEELEFDVMTESTYSYEGTLTSKEDIKKVLISNGLEFNEKFQTWINRFSIEE